MVTAYIAAAMRRATYKILEDQTYYGEIPGFKGLLANAGTLEDCRQQLQEVLEDWLVLGIQLGHELPVIDGIRLAPLEAA